VNRGVGVLVLLAAGLGSAFGPAAPLVAQELGTDCELESFQEVVSETPSPGARVTWLSRPVMVCPDGTRLRADSAVVTERNRHVELIGGVRYQTADRLLESDVADYWELEERLHARGSVVFRDVARGSVIRGGDLVHLAAGARRPVEEVTVSGGRPSAEIPARGQAVEGEATPYRVLGDRLRFEGEDHFWADGDVEVYRDDLEAYADSLAFDQEMGQLFLNGNARVLGDAEMEGDRIRMTMPDDVLTSVLIREQGRVRSDDIDLTGDEIRIELLDEQIQSVVAVQRSGDGDPAGGEAGAVQEPGQRARAVTEDFVLEGDSLFVSAPEGILRQVHAMGRARGESRGRGEAVAIVSPDEEVRPEEGLERIPELTDSDWIEGDEILASFERVPERAPDDETVEPDPEVPPPLELVDAEEREARAEYRLERLEARGNARSLYRTPPEDDDEDPEGADDMRRWSISYIVAHEILVYMVEGELDRLEAVDQVLGIQLEPERRAAPEGGTAPDPEEEG
jgi:hypothetical protein